MSMTRLIDDETRQCTRCGMVYSMDEFTPHGVICSYCKATMSQVRGAAKDVQRGHAVDIIPAARHRRCSECGEVHPIDEYAANSKKVCKGCVQLEHAAEINIANTASMINLIEMIAVGKGITFDDVFIAEAWILERKYRGIALTNLEIGVLRDAAYLRERKRKDQ